MCPFNSIIYRPPTHHVPIENEWLFLPSVGRLYISVFILKTCIFHVKFLIVPEKSSQGTIDPPTEVQVKDEPEWDASSIEEEERSIAEMFQSEMNVKPEPVDDVDIEEEGLVIIFN